MIILTNSNEAVLATLYPNASNNILISYIDQNNTTGNYTQSKTIVTGDGGNGYAVLYWW